MKGHLNKMYLLKKEKKKDCWKFLSILFWILKISKNFIVKLWSIGILDYFIVRFADFYV
jgi:hypothetical protein